MAFLDNTGLSRLWQHVLALAADLTPKSRKINGKSLDADVTITAADLGLEQAMKFLGTSGIAISDGDTDPNITVGGQAVVAELGNVVLYNGKEYVFSSAGWEELGDEGSHALKSITISAGNGLEGGGDLSANRTISAKAGTGITVNSSGIHNAGVRAIAQDGTDGHKLTINTGGTSTTITIPDNDTTYSEATTSAAGLMSAADKTFVDGITATATELNYMDGVTSSVQSQLDGKMSATNPVGTGSFSLGRKAGTVIGTNSIALGSNVACEGYYSVAEGLRTQVDGMAAHGEGSDTYAFGNYSHTEGLKTKATGVAQHVQGKYNISINNDDTFAHIVGNGDSSTLSNAHTLDWNGNAWFAGDVYVGSTSGTNKDEGSVKLATVAEVPTIQIVRW